MDHNSWCITNSSCNCDAKEKKVADNQGLHLTTVHESNVDWPHTAKQIVKDWAVHGLGVSPEANFYIVWFSFTLGNWKALISSSEPDGRYYEVTYNVDEMEAYIDTYKKTHNQCTLIVPPGKDII